MNNDIEQLLKATIQTKVVEAFNETPAMIDKLVQAAISKEVNENGREPSYSDRKKMPYMEWLVGEEIRKAIAESVQEYVTNNKNAIRSRVDETISKSNFSNTLTKTLSKIMSEEWRWSVDLKVHEMD